MVISGWWIFQRFWFSTIWFFFSFFFTIKFYCFCIFSSFCLLRKIKGTWKKKFGHILEGKTDNNWASNAEQSVTCPSLAVYMRSWCSIYLLWWVKFISWKENYTEKHRETLAFMGCALYIKMMLLTPGHWGNFSISSWLQLPNLGNEPDTIASSRMIARDIKCCGCHFFSASIASAKQ